MRIFARVLALSLLAASLGGCQAIGALTQSLGSVLTLALSLALIAAPIALSYYLYKK